MLAFTEDPHLLEILSNTTVLLVPTINGNGRAANTRGNETGADLNRDHAELLQPETKAFASMLRDYTPEVGIDLHEGDDEDLPILSARHRQRLRAAVQRGQERARRGVDVRERRPFRLVGRPVQQRRRQPRGDPAQHVRPQEHRRACSPRTALRAARHDRRRGRRSGTATGSRTGASGRSSRHWSTTGSGGAQIHTAVEGAIAFNTANIGPAFVRGAYPWPAFPAFPAHPLPDVDAPTPARTLDPAPCGYFLTEAQYSGPLSAGTVGAPARPPRDRAGDPPARGTSFA